VRLTRKGGHVPDSPHGDGQQQLARVRLSVFIAALQGFSFRATALFFQKSLNSKGGREKMKKVIKKENKPQTPSGAQKDEISEKDLGKVAGGLNIGSQTGGAGSGR
jgi:hypothetical protein